MNIDIAARHTELSDGIKDYIRDRGARMSRFFEGADRAEFVLDQEAGKHTVEIKVHVPGNDLTARFAHDDLHAAVDGALDKIEKQVRRLKDKFKNHHRGEKNSSPGGRATDESSEETYTEALDKEF